MIVIVAGAINLDKFYVVEKIVPPGHTVKAIEHYISLGGKGANQAAACSMAGAQTYLISMVGGSSQDFIMQQLQGKGVKCDLLGRSPGTDLEAGHAIIQVESNESKTANNAIIIHGGLNDMVTGDFIKVQMRPQLDVASYLILQNELSWNATLESAKYAKSHSSIITVWNPSPVPSMDTQIPSKLFDIIIVNEFELSHLDSMKDALEPELLVVTRGSLGVSYSLRGEPYTDVPVGKSKHPLRIVDTTGAGDCWLGYFIGNLQSAPLLHEHIVKAIRIANTAAGISITRKGAMQSIPKAEEVYDALSTLSFDDK